MITMALHSLWYWVTMYSCKLLEFFLSSQVQHQGLVMQSSLQCEHQACPANGVAF